MQDDGIIYWAETLVDSKKSRRGLIQDLLNHSNEDGMTGADRTVCVRAIRLIDEGIIPNLPPQPQASVFDEAAL